MSKPSLDELAEQVASGEAVPGEEMTPEEIAELTPYQVADLTMAPEDQADPVPRETDSEPQVVACPTGILRQIILGNLAPEGKPGPLVCGAQVSFSHRPGKWRYAEVLIIAGTGKDGEVLVDLELGDAEHTLKKAVPYGEGIGCWKFRE